MSKEAVQVIVRTRPTSNFAQNCLKIDTEKNTIEVKMEKAKGQAINNQQENWNFKLDKILHNASQEAVFDIAARDIVDSVMEGYNGTILAYGQTGAGKTFTMNGGTQSYQHRGVVPRALGHLFRCINAKPEVASVVRLSYIEIYNETYYDLLAEPGVAQPELAVRDRADGVVEVKGLTKLVAESEEAALNHLFTGETNRAIAQHQMNANSTRSHCIFTIYLESRSRIESSEKVVMAKLNMVDLAGSERVGKTGSTGMTLKEAQYINKSLTFLEQVVIALANKKRDHIPFRQSKLTNLLRDSLGGNCKTRMIANIWAEKEQLDETISTLKFALRMMRISNEATVNVQLDPLVLLKKYQREIRELKQELAMHDTLANRSGVNYEPYTPEQQTELRRTVKRYIDGDIVNIDVQSLRQINEIFQQFKNVALDYKVLLEQGGGAGYGAGSDAAGSDPASRAQSAKRDGQTTSDGMVGDTVGDGFAVGLAHDGARPSSQMDGIDVTKAARQAAATKNKAEMDSYNKATAVEEDEEEDRDPSQPPPSEDKALHEYKTGEGKEHQDIYLTNKKDLAEKKSALKKLSLQVNDTKKKIDDLNSKIALTRAQREADQTEDGVQVIDEEEYAFIRQVKEMKKMYATQFNERKIVSSEVSYLKGLVETSKMNLCNKFLEWYTNKYGDIQQATQAATEEDVLDDGEKFDKMEMEKIMAADPDSVSYYNAKKIVSHNKRHGKIAGRNPAKR
mmetsp:Transcript_16565/g.23255  ORF Transcript_16565/g.23255 Transcript_16565/m.23255 type:complete len:736 (-) Transcript_16565:54-2261(-)|eukprot:CAMPEP_0175093002 /NCGR_PEP_ID=MMETSP0086_2-20121207/2763_1 /TAXON_ID=136419 /ORGANISM="Unknown Unknown, Strain D1" /LENGTH=735 /DNA_ID=CAMNT_0016365901 /DNA_START=96 /DNA_END=2303 /DNA_ORIENTATION=-